MIGREFAVRYISRAMLSLKDLAEFFHSLLCRFVSSPAHYA